MKRNKFFMLGIVTVLVAVLSLTFVSNTFAKYTSTVTGNDTAKVAKWAFECDGSAFGLSVPTSPVTFNLLETRYDSDGSSAETDVKNDLIAPGTQGKFDIVLTNKSEVTATYKIDFTVDEAGVPLQWSTDGTNWTDELADITVPVKLAMETGSDTVVVYWRWAFNSGNDSLDTSLGITTPDVTVTMAITFEQVD